MTPYCLSGVIQVSGSPENPNWFEKCYLYPFKAKIFTVDTKLKVSAHTRSRNIFGSKEE